MDRRALERITSAIAFSAAIAVTASYAFGGLRVGTGALAGAAVSLGNWQFLRWILTRVARGSTRTRAAMMTLLATKLGVLGLIVWVVIGLFGLHAGGFGLGLGALVVGLSVGALQSLGSDEAEPLTLGPDGLALAGGPSVDGALADTALDSARKEH